MTLGVWLKPAFRTSSHVARRAGRVPTISQLIHSYTPHPKTRFWNKMYLPPSSVAFHGGELGSTTPTASHQLATHKHRSLNSRSPVLVWTAQTPCMKAYLTGKVDRSAAAPASPPPPPPPPPPTTTSISPHSNPQHSASTTIRTAISWHRNSAWDRGGKE